MQLRKNSINFICKDLPVPSKDFIDKAKSYFMNSFTISPDCNMSLKQIKNKIKEFSWHYPFEFNKIFIDSNLKGSKGLYGRHYQRYLHIFPALLSLTNGSLSGNTVLDIGCNCGFWSIQARLAGSDSVLGIDASQKNIEQANFILKLTGLDNIRYQIMDFQDISANNIGKFDITFFLGILYHLNKPIIAFENLFKLTKKILIVDTKLNPSDKPILELKNDILLNKQNFSNKIAFLPSKTAVDIMLRHAGFSEIYWIQNRNTNLPPVYLQGQRGTCIAFK